MRRRIGRLRAATIFGACLLAASGLRADPQATPATAPEELAGGKPATASTSQADDLRPGAAFDGEPATRWCASDGSVPQWLQVDLGKSEDLAGCRVAWEREGPHYAFKVEGSADGKTWTTLVDRTGAYDAEPGRPLKFGAKGVRFVRLTVTGTGQGLWPSVAEFRVFGARMVPAVAQTGPKRVDDQAILKDIKAPAGFEVTAFAGPPDVRYPTCLAAAPTGEVFVGIDENGSLDAKAGRGRVVRCVDLDDDGKADKFTVFASMDSPRGVIWDAGTLYVLHPPDLTAYHDDDGDGVSDRSETLVKGIGFDLKFRGADHTTNGIRLGIDGYIYVAVGDYGFIKAEGKDGTTLPFLGGGVVRVRTNGSGLEVVSRGQRNIYDVAIDPYMDLFTRDNTNDGGGWDVRLSHVIPTGQYGYPSLFVRFPDEIVPPLADYGGGSPCGSLYLQEPGFPKEFGDTLYTCEWGRGGIFRHPLERAGAGFKAGQEMFVQMPRPTDMDVDGRGRIFVSSWKDGGFNYSKPEIGYVIRLKHKGVPPESFPDLKAATDEKLAFHIASVSSVLRLAAQRELLRRGIKPATAKYLERIAASVGPLPGRVAATFTLEQGLGGRSVPFLSMLAKADREARDFAFKHDSSDRDAREFAIKAMADVPRGEAKVDSKEVEAHAADPDPRVRLQVAIALGRLGQAQAAPSVLPLTVDADPLVAHAAVKALVALDAVDACLKALDDPKLAPGASRALQALHESRVVAGLIRKSEGPKDSPARKPALKALCRLYFREAPYEGKWWTTRPDTSGPYYNAVTWEGSEPVGRALRAALKQADDATARWLLAEILRNKLDFEETTALALKFAGQDPAIRSAIVDLMAGRKDLPFDAIPFLEKVATSDPEPPSRVKALRGLLRHAHQPEAREAGLRGLAAIGMQDEPSADLAGAWLDYARDGRHNRDVGTFARLAEGPDPGKGVLGYGVLIQVEQNAKAPEASRLDARKAIERAWDRPESATRLLRAVGLARAKGYAPKVGPLLAGGPSEVRHAAEFAANRLGIAPKSAGTPAKPAGKPIAATPYDQILAAVLKDKGDASVGAQLFEKQGCVNCHSVAKGEALKGPYLGDITNRYSRAELTESILKPSLRIAQGFETQKLALSSGQVYEGFVVREAGDEIEMRNSAGAVTVLSKKDIEERGKSELSVMPQGLMDPLTPHDLASILAYLESLKGK